MKQESKSKEHPNADAYRLNRSMTQAVVICCSDQPSIFPPFVQDVKAKKSYLLNLTILAKMCTVPLCMVKRSQVVFIHIAGLSKQ